MTRPTDKPPSKTQACAVPYRYDNGQLEFCLITSSEGRWGFPKGNIDPGETAEEAALREALEEAGLHGTIVGELPGSYEFERLDATLDVTALLMEVESCDADWQEAGRRQRCWVTLDQARELIDQDTLHEIFDAAVNRLKD